MRSRSPGSDLLAAIRKIEQEESNARSSGRGQTMDGIGSIDVSTVRRAETFAARIDAVLKGPGGAHAGAGAARVLVESLLSYLEDFERDWLDRPEDRLQAMLNLSRSLDESAAELRGNVAMLIAIVLEHRNLLDDPPQSARTPVASKLIADIGTELASLAPEGEPESVARFEDAVIGNCRSRIFHAIGSPHARRINASNRVVFASAEAAILEGYRPATEKGGGADSM